MKKNQNISRDKYERKNIKLINKFGMNLKKTKEIMFFLLALLILLIFSNVYNINEYYLVLQKTFKMADELYMQGIGIFILGAFLSLLLIVLKLILIMKILIAFYLKATIIKFIFLTVYIPILIYIRLKILKHHLKVSGCFFCEKVTTLKRIRNSKISYQKRRRTIFIRNLQAIWPPLF
ncbi:MAG: hypothetical protein ACRCUP_04455 [Mycoplasmatales bacterium]